MRFDAPDMTRVFSVSARAMVFLVLAVLAVALAAPPAFSGEPLPKTLSVIGVRNDIKKKGWNDQLIGYGLSHLLLQKLHDTGLYVPVEDNPEILDAVDKMVQTQWDGNGKFYSAKDADKIATDLNCDAVAYARAVKFSTRRRRGLAGPFSSAKTTVIVDIEVYLKEKDKKLKKAKGRGRAATKSVGVFFHVRKDKIYFDETTVGKAATQALEEAIKKLKLSKK